MSILIKGMEMPKSCEQCWFFGSDSVEIGYCYLLKGELPMPDGVPQDCPLIPVPPHEDLIESSVIKKAINDACAECKEACIEFDGFYADCNQCIFHDVKKAIDEATTIIPASDKDTNVLGKEEGE